MRTFSRIGCRLAALACLVAATPAEAEQPPHPEPRVIVNVLSVKGPHARGEVERAARLGWGRIVRCYKSIDAQARGRAELELVISESGQVTSARQTRTTLRRPELPSCLASAMKAMGMPKASAQSTASVEIHVAPGD
jgi:hypothetical protein